MVCERRTLDPRSRLPTQKGTPVEGEILNIPHFRIDPSNTADLETQGSWNHNSETKKASRMVERVKFSVVPEAEQPQLWKTSRVQAEQWGKPIKATSENMNGNGSGANRRILVSVG